MHTVHYHLHVIDQTINDYAYLTWTRNMETIFAHLTCFLELVNWSEVFEIRRLA